MKFDESRPRYGLRKLNIGLASVLLGTAVYGVNSQVHADVAASAVTSDSLSTRLVSSSELYGVTGSKNVGVGLSESKAAVNNGQYRPGYTINYVDGSGRVLKTTQGEINPGVSNNFNYQVPEGYVISNRNGLPSTGSVDGNGTILWDGSSNLPSNVTRDTGVSRTEWNISKNTPAASSTSIVSTGHGDNYTPLNTGLMSSTAYSPAIVQWNSSNTVRLDPKSESLYESLPLYQEDNRWGMLDAREVTGSGVFATLTYDCSKVWQNDTNLSLSKIVLTFSDLETAPVNDGSSWDKPVVVVLNKRDNQQSGLFLLGTASSYNVRIDIYDVRGNKINVPDSKDLLAVNTSSDTIIFDTKHTKQLGLRGENGSSAGILDDASSQNHSGYYRNGWAITDGTKAGVLAWRPPLFVQGAFNKGVRIGLIDRSSGNPTGGGNFQGLNRYNLGDRSGTVYVKNQEVKRTIRFVNALNGQSIVPDVQQSVSFTKFSTDGKNYVDGSFQNSKQSFSHIDIPKIIGYKTQATPDFLNNQVADLNNLHNFEDTIYYVPEESYIITVPVSPAIVDISGQYDKYSGLAVDRHYRVIEDLPNGQQKVILDVQAKVLRHAKKSMATGEITYGNYYSAAPNVPSNLLTKILNNASPFNEVQGPHDDCAGISVDQIDGYSWYLDYNNAGFNQAVKVVPAKAGNTSINGWRWQCDGVWFDLINGVDGGTEILPSRDFHVKYTPNQQAVDWKFVDDDSGIVIKSGKLTGVTNQTVNTNFVLPDGYVLANGSTMPLSFAFKASGNGPIIVHLTQAIIVVDPKDPTGWPIDKTGRRLTRDDFERVKSRTVTINLPNEAPLVTSQRVQFTRTVQFNRATKEFIFGAWDTPSKVLTGVSVPVRRGYTVSQDKVDPITVNPDTAIVQDVVVNYTKLPDILIDPHDPTTWTDKVLKRDLVRTVTRQIVIVSPNNKYSGCEFKQTITFYRNARQDRATDQVTFGMWTENGKHQFVGAVTSIINGYTPSMNKVDNVTVTPDSQDSTITITYTANEQPVAVNWKTTDGKVVTSKTIVGKTDAVMNLRDLKVEPDAGGLAGYRVAQNQILPTITVQPGGTTVTILVNPVVTSEIETSNQVRTILVNYPDGHQETIDQKAVWQRVNSFENGKLIKSSDWQLIGPNVFPSLRLKEIAGYQTPIVRAAAVPRPGEKVGNVVISYLALPKQITPKFVDDDGKTYQILPTGYHVAADQQGKYGTQLILKDSTPIIAKAEYVTRTITVTMPNGKVRTIKSKVMKNKSFSNTRLPRLKGYKLVIEGGLIAKHLAKHDEHVTVKYVKL